MIEESGQTFGLKKYLSPKHKELSRGALLPSQLVPCIDIVEITHMRRLGFSSCFFPPLFY